MICYFLSFFEYVKKMSEANFFPHFPSLHTLTHVKRRQMHGIPSACLVRLILSGTKAYFIVLRTLFPDATHSEIVLYNHLLASVVKF